MNVKRNAKLVASPDRAAASFASRAWAHRSIGVGARLCAPQRPQAFTLMEMLLALSISAIVLAGIGGVFFSAMRLRERTTAMLDASGSLYQALSIMRRDLQGTLPP